MKRDFSLHPCARPEILLDSSLNAARINLCLARDAGPAQAALAHLDSCTYYLCRDKNRLSRWPYSHSHLFQPAPYRAWADAVNLRQLSGSFASFVPTFQNLKLTLRKPNLVSVVNHSRSPCHDHSSLPATTTTPRSCTAMGLRSVRFQKSLLLCHPNRSSSRVPSFCRQCLSLK